MAQLTEEQINAQIDKAIANQSKINLIEPRANQVSFNQQQNRITINFDNGTIFSFLTDSIGIISNLPTEVLATVELTPSGKGLRWDEPDIDLSIIGLIMKVFGSQQPRKEITKVKNK